MWNVLDRFSEQVRQYSTPIGQLWNTVTFVFRLFVIVAVGSSVYGDEQGAFKCDTGQPGCQNVCFNRFSPISHMRFWAFQILFVSCPAVFFYMYAGAQTGQVKMLEKEKKDLKEKRADFDKAEQEIFNEINEDDMDGRKSVAAMSRVDEKRIDLSEAEAKVAKREKRVGRYKEKEVNEIVKGGTLTAVIFTTRLRIMYIAHCIIKGVLEGLFIYLAYLLQHQQSKQWGLNCWTVPEKYVCTHALDYGAAGSACAQQEKVTCWVSRPWEKQVFLLYMTSMSVLSFILTVMECFYMVFHVSRKGLQRRAMDRVAGGTDRDSYFNGNMTSPYGDNMMTMRSGMSIKRGLAAANAYRYANTNRTGRSHSLVPPYYQVQDQRYAFAGPPIIDDFLPDDGVPLFPRSRGGTYRKQYPNMANGASNGHVHQNGHINGFANGHLPTKQESVDGELVAIAHEKEKATTTSSKSPAGEAVISRD